MQSLENTQTTYQEEQLTYQREEFELEKAELTMNEKKGSEDGSIWDSRDECGGEIYEIQDRLT